MTTRGSDYGDSRALIGYQLKATVGDVSNILGGVQGKSLKGKQWG